MSVGGFFCCLVNDEWANKEETTNIKQWPLDDAEEEKRVEKKSKRIDMTGCI